MKDRLSRMLVPSTLLLCCLLTVCVSILRPGYLSSAYYLGALIFLQILMAALWHYRTTFLPLLVVVFLWAGVGLPLSGVWTSGRWFVLITGALVGFVIYMKDRHHHFATFHLVAFFCVVAALVSAVVSAYPGLATLKALSLLLLFLYGAAGARLAVVDREAKFRSGLLLSCEILIYFSAICYFIFHYELFGNPNSLGAVMGVVGVPVMLWGVLVTEPVMVRRRRTFAFLLSLLLVLSSYARAGIAGAALACVLLGLGLRQYRMLIKGAGIALLSAMLIVTLMPLQSDQPETVTSSFIYKGRQDAGVFGSRKSAWERTSSVIRDNPWFGSGFGTSSTRDEVTQQVETYLSTPQATREHGNSYMAILEWTGLLGVLPFFTLVFLVILNIKRVFTWMRRTGDARSLAVPIAAVMTAGLVHAAFEDWIFAVGYYLCVFFWTLAFVLVDVLPAPELAVAPAGAARGARDWTNNLGVAAPSR